MSAESPQLRVLLFFSDTGGGHRAAAEALREELIALKQPCAVFMEDLLLRHTIWPLRSGDRFYFWAVTRAPWFWKAFYYTTALPGIYQSLYKPLGPLLTPRLREIFARYRPDIVVSLHPLMNHLPFQVLHRWAQSQGRSRIPYVTVITDLTTFHPSWINPKVDLIVVPTEEARVRAIRFGAPPGKLRVLGLPIRSAFRNLPQDRAAVRRALGLQPNKPVVLLMAGGQGMGPVAKIAQAVAHAGIDAQLVIIAGRNPALQRQLNAISWPIPTKVLGFVHDVHLWMAASDVLLTKAGPGTIAEALTCGLPMILYAYIPGQERGNVDFVVQHGVGLYVEEPEAIARTVRAWLADTEGTLAKMRQRALQLARPHATTAIAQAILSLVAHPPSDATYTNALLTPRQVPLAHEPPANEPPPGA